MPLPGAHPRRARHLLHPRPVRRAQDELVRTLVVQVDEAGVGFQRGRDLARDQREHLVEVEGRVDRLDRLGQQAQVSFAGIHLSDYRPGLDDDLRLAPVPARHGRFPARGRSRRGHRPRHSGTTPRATQEIALRLVLVQHPAWIVGAIVLLVAGNVVGALGGRREDATRQLAEELAEKGDAPSVALHDLLRPSRFLCGGVEGRARTDGLEAGRMTIASLCGPTCGSQFFVHVFGALALFGGAPWRSCRCTPPPTRCCSAASPSSSRRRITLYFTGYWLIGHEGLDERVAWFFMSGSLTSREPPDSASSPIR